MVCELHLLLAIAGRTSITMIVQLSPTPKNVF